jgi:hypothetical protein
MNIKRFFVNRTSYLVTVLTAVIVVLLALLLKQDRQIEVLVRQLYSPKSLIYKEDKDLKLVVSCDGGLMLPKNDKNNYFLVDIMVVNQTRRIQEFTTYSCAVLSNIITDSDNIRFFYQRCSGNGPMVITLKPNQRFKMPVIMQIDKESFYKNNKIKFGFVILNPNDVRDTFVSQQLEEMRENKENIIWSEPLELSGTSNTPFRIEDLTIPIKSIL